MRDWFNYNWEHQKTLSKCLAFSHWLIGEPIKSDVGLIADENLLVDILPTKMKTDLFISVHYETLSKVSLFQVRLDIIIENDDVVLYRLPMLSLSRIMVYYETESAYDNNFPSHSEIFV